VILLVEDDARDEALTRRALKKNNIANEIVVVRDGVEALEYLFATGAYTGRDLTINPQVVLLDLKLPKRNGLEVLQEIRADVRTKRLPVVVFTSSSEEEDMIKSYDLGANSYVRKPVDFDHFLEDFEGQIHWLELSRRRSDQWAKWDETKMSVKFSLAHRARNNRKIITLRNAVPRQEFQESRQYLIVAMRSRYRQKANLNNAPPRRKIGIQVFKF